MEKYSAINCKNFNSSNAEIFGVYYKLCVTQNCVDWEDCDRQVEIPAVHFEAINEPPQKEEP